MVIFHVNLDLLVVILTIFTTYTWNMNPHSSMMKTYGALFHHLMFHSHLPFQMSYYIIPLISSHNDYTLPLSLLSNTILVSWHQTGKSFWISKRRSDGSGISWTICNKFALRSRQITTLDFLVIAKSFSALEVDNFMRYINLLTYLLSIIHS